jgi:hypothetical protein
MSLLRTPAPALLLLLLAGAAHAQAPAERPPTVLVPVERRAEPPRSTRLRERPLLTGAEEVDASAALDEMLDELAADLVRVGSARASPVLLERITVSDNIHPRFAAILEARLAAALQRAASFAVMRCTECWATRGRIEQGAWVVTRGATRRDELKALADTYGARTLLSAYLSLDEAPQTLALDVQLVRAEDSTITFAEGYRFHPDTALLSRGADTAQARDARLRDLEDRVAGRTSFGHGALIGVMRVPSKAPEGAIIAPYASYRLYEKFGDARQHRFGLSMGGVLSGQRLAGGILAMGLWTQLSGQNLFSPSLHVGASVGALITGGAGNSPLFTLHGEYLFGQRLAAQVSLGYLIPFDLAERGHDVGGIIPQGGVAFLW